MHKDDVWQVFSHNGEPIKDKSWDAAKDNPTKEDNVIVGGAATFLYRKTASGIEMLWQKRAEGVDNGGLWDYSAGGHVNLGESFAEAAVRETDEEIGAKVRLDELRLVSVRLIRGLLFRAVYLVDWTGKPEDFHFDDGEVAEVRWVPLAKTKEFQEDFAKPSVKKDKATFYLINDWFEEQTNLESSNGDL